MKIITCTFLVLLLLLTHSHAANVQLGLVLDASASTDDEELPIFVQGVANAIGKLKTDGSIELTISQFRAIGKVIYGPVVVDSEEIRQGAVNRVLALDPAETNDPPFDSGTNIEDGLLVTREAMQASSEASQASLQFINVLTDGNPTMHNHIGFADIDSEARHIRAQEFALAERNVLIAAGIDVISFEALGSRPEDIDYLMTLAYPEPATLIESVDNGFPDPITSSGFVLKIATLEGIEAALSAKFDAAGFAVGEPDPLLKVTGIDVDREKGEITIQWTGTPGMSYQVEYTSNFQDWMTDLPGSLLEATAEMPDLSFTDTPGAGTGLRIYRIREVAP